MRSFPVSGPLLSESMFYHRYPIEYWCSARFHTSANFLSINPLLCGISNPVNSFVYDTIVERSISHLTLRCENSNAGGDCDIVIVSLNSDIKHICFCGSHNHVDFRPLKSWFLSISLKHHSFTTHIFHSIVLHLTESALLHKLTLTSFTGPFSCLSWGLMPATRWFSISH